MRKIFISFSLGILIALGFNYYQIAPNFAVEKEPIPIIISPDTDNGRHFKKIIKYAINNDLAERSMAEIIQEVAVKFLGTKYQAGLLDRSSEETLVVTFNEFDCLIYVETVLAIADNIAWQDYRYQSFTNNLIERRYRNGNIDGYCSRLHYFSEWIEDNQKRENIENITLNLGGIPLDKQLTFMSAHRSSYPQTIKNEDNYQCIVEMESNLEGLTINYIPTKDIQKIYNKLRSGDIIALATNINGLDVTHTGLIYRDESEKVAFIHASPAGKVTVTPDLLAYISNIKNTIGIIVARPLDPRK